MVKITGGKQFVACDSDDVENNSIFLDSSDNILKKKDNSGVISVLGASLFNETTDNGIFPISTIGSTTLHYNVKKDLSPVIIASSEIVNGTSSNFKLKLNYTGSNNDEWLLDYASTWGYFASKIIISDIIPS